MVYKSNSTCYTVYMVDTAIHTYTKGLDMTIQYDMHVHNVNDSIKLLEQLGKEKQVITLMFFQGEMAGEDYSLSFATGIPHIISTDDSGVFTLLLLDADGVVIFEETAYGVGSNGQDFVIGPITDYVTS